MRLGSALIAAALAASPASAEVVTKCQNELGKLVCRTDAAGPQPYPFTSTTEGARRGYDVGRRLREDAAPPPPAPASSPRPPGLITQTLELGRTELLRQSVIKAIQEHRCSDAKSLAIDGGDLDLADQAVRLCEPK